MNNLYELFVTHFFTVCHFFKYFALFLEAVVQGCSVKQLFLKIPLNSQENVLGSLLIKF